MMVSNRRMVSEMRIELERVGNVKMVLIPDDTITDMIAVHKVYYDNEKIRCVDEIFLSKEDWKQIGEIMKWK